MKERGKTILIVLALIGVATIAALLIIKIGEIGKINSAASNATSYYCSLSGYTLSKDHKSCYKTIKADECTPGYTYSSQYNLCYKKSGQRSAYDYYCGSKMDTLKNLPGLGYVCTTESVCTMYSNLYNASDSKISVSKSGNLCKFTMASIPKRNNWNMDSKGFFYYNSNGKRKKSGWQKGAYGLCYIKNYYLKSGLTKIDSKWYYLAVEGSVNSKQPTCNSYKYSWHCNKTKKSYWYGYNSKYYLKNGSYKIGNKTYKFDSNGYCVGSNCHNEKCK